jgi:GDP-4-dehydro-6-deoxy-D-mannose reductase
MKQKKRVLITGITGFAGSHLAELLLKENFIVFGFSRWRSKTENIDSFKSKLQLIEADLLDSHSVQKAMIAIRPNYIFHLAGQSFVAASWTSPAVTLEINVVGSANLFEAVRTAQIDPVIQIACSSEEYGFVRPEEIPIKETNPFRPQSPYGVSKLAMDYLGYQYFKSYGMKIVRTRGFNHTGPRRGDVFAESTFAKQIAEIEKKKGKPVIFVGNLEAKRDYTDVRDMVNGYYLAALKGEPGDVYNICSGKATRIGDVLEMLLAMSKVKVRVKHDPTRVRPSDVPILQGDSSKFRQKTGWAPKIPLEKTLKDLLNYWREKI